MARAKCHDFPMRHLAAALVALSACTGPVTGTDADDPGIDDPPIVFPATDMGTRLDAGSTSSDLAGPWMCIAVVGYDGAMCGCAGLPCCDHGELERARSERGFPPYPNDYCNGVNPDGRPLGYSEACVKFGVGVYRCSARN